MLRSRSEILFKCKNMSKSWRVLGTEIRKTDNMFIKLVKIIKMIPLTTMKNALRLDRP